MMKQTVHVGLRSVAWLPLELRKKPLDFTRE